MLFLIRRQKKKIKNNQQLPEFGGDDGATGAQEEPEGRLRHVTSRQRPVDS
jgi:hypothetical protein